MLVWYPQDASWNVNRFCSLRREIAQYAGRKNLSLPPLPIRPSTKNEEAGGYLGKAPQMLALDRLVRLNQGVVCETIQTQRGF